MGLLQLFMLTGVHGSRSRRSKMRAHFNPKRKGLVLAKRFGKVKC